MSKEYLDKPQAAKRLGISPRRLLELAASGRIKRHYLKNTRSQRKIVTFKTDDVERLARERDEQALLPPSYEPHSTSQLSLKVNKHKGTVHGGSDLASLATLISTKLLPAAPAGPPREWLTVEEAANYTGLPASFLLELIHKTMELKRLAGPRLPALDVGVRPGGRWRISKRDLDALSATTMPKG